MRSSAGMWVPGRWLLGALLMGVVAAGCVRNPATGKRQLVFMGTDTEVALGREEALKVERVMGFSRHARATEYVEQVGRRLAAASPRQDVTYSFHLVDTPEPNAFALPGGPVYVSRGLLALLNGEDELAGVLGHEIGHVAARHAVRRVTVATPFAILAGLPAAIVGSVSRTLGAVVAAPAAIAGGVVLAPFGREQEREADRIGAKIAARAGYDPRGLARALATLEREDYLRRGEARKADFFASHPSSPERVREVERLAETIVERGRALPLAPDRRAFLGKIEGLLVGPNPDAGVFLGERFVHPALGISVRFPEGWQTENLPEMVVALDPDSNGRVFVLLQISGDGDDPAVGPEVDGLDEERRAAVVTSRIGGREVAGLFTTHKGTAFHLTWLAMGGQIYRLSGVAPLASYDRFGEVFEEVDRSFGAITSADLAAVQEGRLRVVAARAGESLTELARRSGTRWDPEFIAAVNGLESARSPLGPGFDVKIVLEERYAR